MVSQADHVDRFWTEVDQKGRVDRLDFAHDSHTESVSMPPRSACRRSLTLRMARRRINVNDYCRTPYWRGTGLLHQLWRESMQTVRGESRVEHDVAITRNAAHASAIGVGQGTHCPPITKKCGGGPTPVCLSTLSRARVFPACGTRFSERIVCIERHIHESSGLVRHNREPDVFQQRGKAGFIAEDVERGIDS